jgi:hypothetical protein
MSWMRWAVITCLGAALMQGCATPEEPQAEMPVDETTDETIADTSEPDTDGAGTLAFRANGEDFVRQGFVSKDGWEISFDHLYVTLADVTAYQTDPPFDPESGGALEAVETVSIGDTTTVDLAEGDESAEPILIAEMEVPAGRYNALSWQMVNAADGPAEGYTLVMQGTATRDGETVDFTIQMNEELEFICGDFVGDERKGILEADSAADVEATFHFDHVFGDAEAPMDDDINTGALGFDPLAAIAQDGTLIVDSVALQEQLSEAEYVTLTEILPSLGHVGEGHCEEVSDV